MVAFIRPFVGFLLGGAFGGLIAGLAAQTFSLGWELGIFAGGAAGALLAGRLGMWPFRIAGWLAGLLVGGLLAEAIGSSYFGTPY